MERAVHVLGGSPAQRVITHLQAGSTASAKTVVCKKNHLCRESTPQARIRGCRASARAAEDFRPKLADTRRASRIQLGTTRLRASAQEAPVGSQGVFSDNGTSQVDEERVGVLLLNLGGPETLDDVQPFLYNLFADPDIIRLPSYIAFLQQPIARLISTLRAPKSAEGYKAIGGGSPLRRVTEEQATALQECLAELGQPAEVFIGMRYWNPFTEEAVQQIKQSRINKLVVLPLYPQFSISTSGSSLRLLEQLFKVDDYLLAMKHTVIPSWYQRPGYVQAMADMIEHERTKFPDPADAVIFFSAHGVPVSYVEEAGDPYRQEMEECVDLIMDELKLRGVDNRHTLAYQSRVGPVEWLKPYTDTTIELLGQTGVKSLLAVPISFVSEHIETLEEIDMEYRELAEESGITNWGRVPALGVNPVFIRDMADAVLESLPYVGSMSLPSEISLVPSGSVEDLLAAYDRERLELPPPVPVWEWGWTKSAETLNGRIAMVALSTLLLLEAFAGGEGTIFRLLSH